MAASTFKNATSPNACSRMLLSLSRLATAARAHWGLETPPFAIAQPALRASAPFNSGARFVRVHQTHMNGAPLERELAKATAQLLTALDDFGTALREPAKSRKASRNETELADAVTQAEANLEDATSAAAQRFDLLSHAHAALLHAASAFISARRRLAVAGDAFQNRSVSLVEWDAAIKSSHDSESQLRQAYRRTAPAE
ncbi:MAG: hypothetical protein JWN93_3760 [Hyphomicrobiales bacterium]|nr:hypothetical protein [Hyphomicrobiales bacterium]